MVVTHDIPKAADNRNRPRIRPRILVVTGKSGGHIYPALSFLEALEEKYCSIETLLVLPKKSVFDGKELPARKIAYLSVTALSLRPDKKNIKGLLDLCRSFFESAGIISDFKPDVVVGFGSLACLPVVFIAWLSRIRIILHEQNVVPGRANLVLGICADKIAVSFPETLAYLKHYENKSVVTGNPLRKELAILPKKEARNYLGLAEDKFTILVMGGSQGSRKVNEQFMSALPLIKDRKHLQVIHIAGAGDLGYLERLYVREGVANRLFNFLKAMQYAYSASDLAISRAGASTITELIHYKLPAFLVPYPFAYQHQMKNACILSSRGSAKVLEEGSLNAQGLAEEVRSLAEDPTKLDCMRKGFSGIMPPDAAGLLVDLTEEILNYA